MSFFFFFFFYKFSISLTGVTQKQPFQMSCKTGLWLQASGSTSPVLQRQWQVTDSGSLSTVGLV